MIRRRWGDNDKYMGPFTFARDGRYRPIAAVLDSGHDEYPGCSLRLSAFGFTAILSLPAIIKPWRTWVDMSGNSWASEAGGYWDVHNRQYGFSSSEGFLQIFYGPQTHSSITTKSIGYFLPWKEWRFVRHSLYGLDGEHVWSSKETGGPSRFEELSAARDALPKATFRFADFDGEVIHATTHIEEREWLRGDKWCKWLSLFWKPMIRRSLDISFSSEVGARKGSWKGGTLGHGIDMLPGELHREAFKRYCGEHKLTYIDQADQQDGRE